MAESLDNSTILEVFKEAALGNESTPEIRSQLGKGLVAGRDSLGGRFDTSDRRRPGDESLYDLGFLLGRMTFDDERGVDYV